MHSIKSVVYINIIHPSVNNSHVCRLQLHEYSRHHHSERVLDTSGRVRLTGKMSNWSGGRAFCRRISVVTTSRRSSAASGHQRSHSSRSPGGWKTPRFSAALKIYRMSGHDGPCSIAFCWWGPFGLSRDQRWTISLGAVEGPARTAKECALNCQVYVVVFAISVNVSNY